MKRSSGIHTSELIENAVLSNREALRRMIQYAWQEAEKEGVEECAEFLSAALLALEYASVSMDRPRLRSVGN